MKPKIDLKELAARESEQVEWKKNVANIEDVIRTITAFANDFQNMGGGYVVCGAEEAKDEYGFQKVSYPGLTSDRLKEIEGKVMSDAREKIDPAVTPIVEELPGEIVGQRVLISFNSHRLKVRVFQRSFGRCSNWGRQTHNSI